MSTKLVPFTTRPLSTSRQGMTRLSSIEQLVHFGDREAVLVQRLPRDDSREVHEPQRAQAAEVLERPDPAGIEEPAADDLADSVHLGEVGPLEHPVAVDVRVDELTYTATNTRDAQLAMQASRNSTSV